ncbi:MAG TPA: PA14 domain-containing protein, partial [bacterium]|nr:PA14 domain-containing protein [bacterium]
MIKISSRYSVGIGFLLFLTRLAACSQAGPEPNWWQPAWRFRSLVKIITPALTSELKTAVFPFTLVGDARPDLTDLRMVTEKGDPVPFLVQTNAGAETLIYFERQEGVENYYLYYGNPQAQPLPPHFSPRLYPLTLETREKGMRFHPRSLNEMLKLFQASPKVYGQGKRLTIDDLENPFGPNRNFLSHYQGYLYCPEEGQYSLAINSDDGSFLLLDGELLLAWPGAHEKDGGVNRPLENVWYHHRSLPLKKGLHRIDFYHEQGEGATLARVGWKKPGENTFSVIPEEAYLPCLQACLSSRQEQNKPLQVFFSVETVESYLFSSRQPALVKLRFHDLSRSASPVNWRQWKFSDTGSSCQDSPLRVVKENSLLQVALTVSDLSGNKGICRQRILVKPLKKPMRFDFDAGWNTLPHLATEPFPIQLWVASYADSPMQMRLVWSSLDRAGRIIKKGAENFSLSPQASRSFTLPNGPLPGEGRRQVSLFYGEAILVRKNLIFLTPEANLSGLQLKENQLYDCSEECVVCYLAPGSNQMASAGKLAGRRKPTLVLLGSALGQPGAGSWIDFFPAELKKNLPRLSPEIKFFPTDDNLVPPSFLQIISQFQQVLNIRPDVVLLLPGVNE